MQRVIVVRVANPRSPPTLLVSSGPASRAAAVALWLVGVLRARRRREVRALRACHSLPTAMGGRGRQQCSFANMQLVYFEHK